MIQISVRGINLPIKDEVVEREYETNVYDRELKGSDFTLPFTVALTDDVKKAIGFTHLPEAFNIENGIDAVLTISGTISTSVTLKILEISNVDQTMTITLYGDYGSFSSFLADKKLRDLYLDGPRNIGSIDSGANVGIDLPNYTVGISYTPCDTHLHMKAVADGTIITDYVFYQFIDEGPGIPGVHQSGGRSIVNHFIDDAIERYLDPVLEDIYFFFFGSTDPGNSGTDRHFWVPQFRLWYVLRKCFEEIGFTYTADIFSDPAFRKIVLHNTYAINRVKVDDTSIAGFVYIEHRATVINPQNHVPDTTIIDFITEVGKAFNLEYYIDWTNRHVEIVQLKEYVPPPGMLYDITSAVSPDPEVDFASDNIPNGYEFSFEGALDSKADIALYNNRGTYDRLQQLVSLTGSVINDIGYVRSTNTWYQYDGDEWVVFSNNLGSYKTTDKDDLATINCKLQPLAMQTSIVRWLFYTSLDLVGAADQTSEPTSPTSSIGMEGQNLLALEKSEDSLYIWRTDAAVKTENMYMCNWHGMQWNEFSIRYGPWASNGIADHLGNTNTFVAFPGNPGAAAKNPAQLGGQHLVWHNPDGNGLAELYADFVRRTLNSRAFKFEVLMDPNLYQMNMNSAWLLISGQIYRCAKARVQTPLPSIGELTLRRL